MLINDFDILDTANEVEPLFGLPMSDPPAPLVLVWWQDTGNADDSASYTAEFASLEEAELALGIVEQDPACNGIIACWREGNPDPRWDFIPF